MKRVKAASSNSERVGMPLASMFTGSFAPRLRVGCVGTSFANDDAGEIDALVGSVNQSEWVYV